MAFIAQPIIQGSTVDFILNVKKNGVIWDITGATVLLYLFDPDGTVLAPITATVSDGPAGVARHQVTVSVLSTDGSWQRQWKVEKSGVVLWTQKKSFVVEAAAS